MGEGKRRTTGSRV